MKFHDELNPKLWDGLELKPDVKEKLNEIAEAFKEYLDIPEDAILDIRITGSSASYNYTEYSDLDLHLIIDYEKVHEDCPLVEGYLWSYKSQFNANHDISIYDVPVELYAEDSKQEAISNGVYSLMEDRWLKEPKKIPPTDNDEDVQAKYQELKDAIDKCDDSEVANELLDKIYTMRKSGLAEVGEFSTENMAFKLLRNDGNIDKLKKLKKEKVDKQLSLESYQLQERDKSEYLNNSDNQSALRKFSILHQNLIAPLPKPYDGDRDIEAILYYLGSTDGLVARIKTPIETVIFNSRNLNHLIDDNEPERLQDLSKIKETLKNPNLIIKTNEPKTKHNYIKAFGNQDLMKAQLVVVKVLEDGTFYVTTFRLKNRKFLDKLKEGQIIYDLSDTYANIDESISYNNIITYSEKNVKFQKHFKETFNQTNRNKKLTLQSYNEEMYTDEKDVPPLHDYAIIFKYQEPWPDGKLAYRAIMKLTTGSSYRMQSVGYTKEGMINIVKKQWPYADIVDKTNEPVSESYNEENVEKLETLEDLKNYFDTGLETIDCEITYFPYEPTQKVLRITSASPKINREWLKEVSNGKIKLVGVKQHKNRFGGWIKMYDHFYGYVDNINESQEALNTNILKELVQKYPYHTVGTTKEMAKELEGLTDIGCVLEIRESNSWHSCYTIFKKKDINKWEHTYICDGKLIEEQTWIATTYDVAENITSEDNRVNNVTIKQETLESTNRKSIQYPKDREELINKYNGIFEFGDNSLEISNLYNKEKDNYSGGFGKSYNVNGRVFNKFENAIKYMKKLSGGDTTDIKECYNITKLLEEVDMEIRKYKVKLKADNGEEVKITTTATSVQQAIKQVCDQQNAPESAVVSVKECDLDEGFSSIINKLSQLLG